LTLRIGSNINSLTAQRRLSDATDRLASISEKLASGQRINRASDDAAGLAISSSLRADSRVFTQGIRNFNDGLSMLSIAQGALQELSNITQQQFELAEQAANGTYSFQQRLALHRVNAALVQEFNRILESVEFNGLNLIDGSLTSGIRFQGGYGLEGSIFASLGGELSRTVGDGTFTADATVGSGGASGQFDIQTGDFNGDGILDLAGASYTNGSWVSLGNGDGTFRAAVTTTGSAGTYRITIGDFNGDGRDDMIRFVQSGGGEVLLSDGDGSFTAGNVFPGVTAGGMSQGAQVADFDGDGILDMISNDQTNGAVYLYRGNGNGTFNARVTIGSTAYQYRSSIGDINGDGHMDIAFTTITGTRIFLNNGNGTFSSSLGQAGDNRSSALVDVNGDGYLDLLSTTVTTDQMIVSLGNGNGTFGAASTYSFDFGGYNLAYQDLNMADVNGDGVLDAVIALRDSGTSAGSVAILIGNANGTFGAATTLGAITNSISAAVADFNGDGIADIATAVTWGDVRIYEGDPREITSIARQDLTTQENALAALEVLRDQLNRITGELGSVGALQSRMGVAINNLRTASDNYLAAASRITDIDVAVESSQLVLTQILQQSAAAVLAQANQQPNLVLQLLKADDKEK